MSAPSLEPRVMRAVFDRAPDAMVLVDDAGAVLAANAAASRLLDTPSELARVAAEARAAAKAERDWQGTLPYREGRLLEVKASLALEPGVHLFALRDVTAERAAAEALRHSEARFRAILEKSIEAISLTLQNGDTYYLSPSAWKVLGWTNDEMGTMSMRGQIVPEDRPRVSAELEQMAATGQRKFVTEFRAYHRDGSVLWFEATATNLLDDPDVRAIVGNYRDITARKHAEAALARSEEQFRHAQKMEAVGLLAGGVAHDFNNLLTVILSHASISQRGLPDGSVLRQSLQEIETAGQRAAALTRQLLAFSRRQVLAPRVVSLYQVIDGMRSMLQRLLGEDIALRTHEGPGPGHVLADPGQLEQVVMNLAVNARDAMPEGGQLMLETRTVPIEAGHPLLGAGEYVLLTVTDTGTGMDSATRARVFEPFFTTKEMGKGTGLGLSTVFGIVQQSGGHIEVYSEPGLGTAFKVFLPGSKAELDADVALPEASEKPGGTETILVVEDEDGVRQVACTILRRHGYEVLESESAAEAMKASHVFGKPIHLLLTDVVMPDRSGPKLAAELVTHRPELKVLFMSGYTDDAVIQHGLLEASVAFLHKPFSAETLLKKVREVLAGQGGAPLKTASP